MRQFLFSLWTINIQELAHHLNFHFLFAKFEGNIQGRHHPCSSKKLLYSTRTPKKKLKVDGEAGQTTAKSERSRFKKKKWETPHA